MRRLLVLALTICFVSLASAPVFADATYQSLPFSQDWTDLDLITGPDDWSGVPGIVGYRGDGLTTTTDVDPQTVVGDDVPGVVDVIANQFNPVTTPASGVAEFEPDDPAVAIAGSGQADAPYIVIHVDATTETGIVVSYRLRDLEGAGGSDNVVSRVALQFRTTASGSWTNVPDGYVADATLGPGVSGPDTPVSVALPPAAAGAATLQVRIITTNATGNEEWIGVDDISVEGADVTYYTMDVTIVGNGTVTRLPDQASYAEGASVQLTAAADPGWSFAGWSGDAIGLINPTSVTMEANQNVTATFVPAEMFPPHIWSRAYGEDGSGGAECRGVAMDGSANVIFTGRVSGSVDFGGGTLANAGGEDVCLVKFNSLGAHQWSRLFGEADSQRGDGVTTDAAGNVIVVGDFDGTIDFGGDPLTSMGSGDIFIAKFDSNGAHLWSKRFGDLNFQEPNEIVADADGNIIVTGWAEGTTDFGGGPLTAAGGSDAFLAKFDPDGAHLWSRLFPGGGTDRSEGLAVDPNGNSFIMGTYSSANLDMGGGALPYEAGNSLFVAKYDASGNHVWSEGYPTQMVFRCGAIGADGSGNVFVAGEFSLPVNFGGGVLMPSSMPGNDAFLVKFDPAGAHLWSSRFGDAEGLDECTGLAVDEAGNVTIVGDFDGTIDFGGGPLTAAGVGPSFPDLFVAKFSATGFHRWSERFGDEGSPFESYQLARDVVDRSGMVVVGGQFARTVDFGGGVLGSDGAGFTLFVAAFGESPLTGVWPGAFGPISGIDLSVWPNPSRASFNISYRLVAPGTACLNVYGVDGRRVATLLDGYARGIEGSLAWDGRDARGHRVAPGVYFMRLESGPSLAAQERVVLVR